MSQPFKMSLPSRAILLCLLSLAILAGCGKKSSRPARTRSTPTITVSDRLIMETEYYQEGPQKGCPPDGKLPKSTKVELLRDSGSYALIKTEEGLEVYVASEALGNEESELIQHLAGSNNQFALELYDLARRGEGNRFFSPTSITTALGMAYAGAKGETEREIAQVMHWEGLSQEQFHPMMGRLLNDLQVPFEKDGKTLFILVANRLWVQKDFALLPRFVKLTKEHYEAEVEPLDFSGNPQQAIKTINRWTDAQTDGKIPEAVPPDGLSRDTRLVLTNVVYFLGDWTKPFDKEDTREEPFHLSAGKEVQVPLMSQEGHFRYAQDDEVQILEMPFIGGQFAFTALLPQEKNGLENLEKSLSHDKLQAWLKKLDQMEVEVVMPRFEMSWDFRMSEQLRALGMKSAFDLQQADLSGMTAKEKLFLSEVFHKAYIQLDEKGVKAVAVTHGLPTSSAPVPFRADHPFLFLIRDVKSGEIVFLGRLSDPRGN